MPWVSKKQARWGHAAEKRGEIPKGMASRWDAETPSFSRLPERKRKKVRSRRELHGFVVKALDGNWSSQRPR